MRNSEGEVRRKNVEARRQGAGKPEAIEMSMGFSMLLGAAAGRHVTNLVARRAFRSAITSGTGNAIGRVRQTLKSGAIVSIIIGQQGKWRGAGRDRKRAKVILIPSTFAVCVTERRNGNPCTGIGEKPSKGPRDPGRTELDR